MNKPAPKEPSMDEILSSIRQIIADDDASSGARRPTPMPLSSETPAPQRSFEPQPIQSFVPPSREEPLALSADQIVVDRDITRAPEPVQDFSFASVLGQEMPEEAPTLVDPEDVSFEIEADTIEPEPEPEPVFAPAAPSPVVSQSFAPPPQPAPAPQPQQRPAQSVSQAAPMPDPTLSADIAEQLLEPTTGAATRQAFSRLNRLGIGTEGVTLETMVRDLLRPMLKDWLDENLPSVVERMVEKEIARVSRGGFD